MALLVSSALKNCGGGGGGEGGGEGVDISGGGGGTGDGGQATVFLPREHAWPSWKTIGGLIDLCEIGSLGASAVLGWANASDEARTDAWGDKDQVKIMNKRANKILKSYALVKLAVYWGTKNRSEDCGPATNLHNAAQGAFTPESTQGVLAGPYLIKNKVPSAFMSTTKGGRVLAVAVRDYVREQEEAGAAAAQMHTAE